MAACGHLQCGFRVGVWGGRRNNGAPKLGSEGFRGIILVIWGGTSANAAAQISSGVGLCRSGSRPAPASAEFGPFKVRGGPHSRSENRIRVGSRLNGTNERDRDQALKSYLAVRGGLWAQQPPIIPWFRSGWDSGPKQLECGLPKFAPGWGAPAPGGHQQTFLSQRGSENVRAECCDLRDPPPSYRQPVLATQWHGIRWRR